MVIHFSLGSHEGQPSLILASKKGVLLHNGLATLRDQAKSPYVSVDKIQKLGLGPDGKFWLRYKEVLNADGCLWQARRWITSGDLDILTSQGTGGGWTRHFAFGQSACWGVQYEATSPRTFQNDAVPQDFIDATDALGKKGRKPTWRTWDTVNFVAFGVGDAWVFGVGGKPVWSEKLDETYPKLVKMLSATLSAEGKVVRKVRNVELSPVDPDMYWIEYYNGQVASHGLPREWATKINEYTAPQYHLPNPGEQRDYSNGQVVAGVTGAGALTTLAGSCQIM